MCFCSLPRIHESPDCRFLCYILYHSVTYCVTLLHIVSLCYILYHSSLTQRSDVDVVSLSKKEFHYSRGKNSVIKSDFCGMINSVTHMAPNSIIVCLLMCYINFTMGWDHTGRTFDSHAWSLRCSFQQKYKLTPENEVLWLYLLSPSEKLNQ